MKIFVGAGEASGDRILASLLQGLRSRFSDLEITGFGGPLSLAQGLQSMGPIEHLAVNGVGDLFRHGISLAQSYFHFKRALRMFKPDLVLLVDYPGMNVGLVREALRLGYPVHYVAPPQLWAYRNLQSRLLRLRRALRGASLQVLFPFEKQCYTPWVTKLCQGHFFSPPSISPPTGNRLLLCPGSRREVVRRNLPLWLKRLSDWPGGIDILTPEFLARDLEKIILKNPPVVVPVETPRIEVLTDPSKAFSRASVAISFPGTMTMDLVLHRIPTSVWAVLDPLTLWAGRRKLWSEFTALPNLLLEREIFPEWVGTKRDFKRNPPPLLSTLPPVSNVDLAAIEEKMGSSSGMETGVKACLELLL